MSALSLTFSNYRCFPDVHPLRFTIGRGMVALVGPNNAGKSSALKALFELRPLWEAFSQYHVPDASRRYSDPTFAVTVNQYPEVYDPAEILCDRNDRKCMVEVQIDGGCDGVSRAVFTVERKTPQSWSAAFFQSTQAVLSNVGGRFSDGWLMRDQSKLGYYTPMFEALAGLAHAVYFGAHRSAVTGGAGQHYDLSIGADFIKTWNEWKTGPQKAKNRVVERVTCDIAGVFGFRDLDISTSTINNTLQVRIDRRPYKLKELGAGLSQFILVLTTAAIRQPTWILIDEPEANLHPAMQMELLTTLSQYASNGLVFSTHSVGLARATADRIYSVRPGEAGSEVRPFEQTVGYVEFLGEMSFSAFRELGCETLLLVEGVHDVKLVQQFLRLFGKDHRIVVLPMGGNQLAKGGVEHELNELKRIAGSVAVLVDSERAGATASPLKERQELSTLCQRLGYKICVTERRAIECYLTDRAVKQVKGDKYAALGEFERLSDRNPAWAKAENHLIARQMTKDDLAHTDVGRFLASL